MNNDKLKLPEYILDNLKVLCSWRSVDKIRNWITEWLNEDKNNIWRILYKWVGKASDEEIIKFNTLFVLIYNKMYYSNDDQNKESLFVKFQRIIQNSSFWRKWNKYADIEREIENNFDYYVQILNNLYYTPSSKLEPFVDKFKKEYKEYVKSWSSDPFSLYSYFTGDFNYKIEDNTIYMEFGVKNLSEMDLDDLYSLGNWPEIIRIIKNINYSSPFILSYIFKDEDSSIEIDSGNFFISWGREK